MKIIETLVTVAAVVLGILALPVLLFSATSVYLCWRVLVEGYRQIAYGISVLMFYFGFRNPDFEERF